MPKAEWGTKRACPQCNERFYDLNNDPTTCPNCEHVFEIASLYQSDIRSSQSTEKKKDDADFDAVEDDDLLDEGGDVDVDDELLEDDDDSTVSLEEIADVSTNDDE